MKNILGIVWDQFSRIMASSMGTEDGDVFHKEERVSLLVKKFIN